MKLLMYAPLYLGLFISCGDNNTTSTEVESEFTVAGIVLPETYNKKLIQINNEGIAVDSFNIQENGEFNFNTSQSDFLLSSPDSSLQFKYDSSYVDKQIVISSFSKLFVEQESTILGREVNPLELLTLSEGGSLVSLRALEYAYYETIVLNSESAGTDSISTSNPAMKNPSFNQAFVQYYIDNEEFLNEKDVSTWQSDTVWIQERQAELDEARNNQDVQCNEIYAPVCAEGVTYTNSCLAMKASDKSYFEGTCEDLKCTANGCPDSDGDIQPFE